ncbi:MAG: molybdenum cofactor biosynthesis protein MoeA [Candidatus Melainabacteria bacterium RIFOXYA12_FULL_32_12]|nr:MAG: molybdenum cofactor biosynthesis protein MoeA [Candidatus Melainabacteria bacterium RIFOXYA12_FULL_32_12]
MLDRFNREINYIRISVTDKCNLRCIYCMPEEGVPIKDHSEILSYEKIELIVKEAVKLGIAKVRLTGGEPLIKRDIETLVKKISLIDGIRQLCMTTNGTLLSQKIKVLKEAGLNSINISLDTLNPEKYKKITRGGNIQNTLDGIEAALDEGFLLKLNMVVLKGINDDEIESMKEFCYENYISLQLINHFSLNSTKLEQYTFDRPPKCKNCNRIRLLSDGTLKSCLHSEEEYKVDFNNITESLKNIILSKPKKGSMCTSRKMVEIGG